MRTLRLFSFSTDAMLETHRSILNKVPSTSPTHGFCQVEKCPPAWLAHDRHVPLMSQPASCIILIDADVLASQPLQMPKQFSYYLPGTKRHTLELHALCTDFANMPELKSSSNCFWPRIQIIKMPRRISSAAASGLKKRRVTSTSAPCWTRLSLHAPLLTWIELRTRAQSKYDNARSNLMVEVSLRREI